MYKIVVVGGGITGLAATYYLQKIVREQKLPVEVTLIEGSNRLGGKMQTVVRDGFVIERGPDSFLARKTSISRLAAEVGMADQLVHNSTGKSYVLAKDRLYPMPGGSIMGIPTEIGPFVTTGLFSWPGKFRALGDVFLPREPKGDQSMGKFFRHRLGNEVVDNLIEPLLSGIYAGDLDQMSLISTYAQFYEVEQKYRSLIFGMKAMKKQTPKAPKPAAAPSSKEKSKGVFLTFKTGLQSFGEAVAAQIDPEKIRLNTKVSQISKKSEGYELLLNDSELLFADSIIMATPHQVTQQIFSTYDFFEPFKAVPSTSVTTVALAFPHSAIAKDIDGTGFVVSRRSSCMITACTWTHKKWEHSAPEDKILLRAYVGRPGQEELLEKTDEELVAIVMKDLNKIMNLTGEPEFSVVSRWKTAMPQYTVGHKERLALIREKMAEALPGIFLAGASFEGIGIPDCIDQGEKALKESLDFLGLTEKIK